jgi:hypothetical protein
METRLKSKNLIWIFAILLFMSIYPGTGYKAESQQAIVSTDLPCTTYKDCPTCVGGFMEHKEYDPLNRTIFQELSYAKCDGGVCKLSEYCVYWNCGTQANCTSVKQTLLDNTVGKIQQNPMYLVGIIGLIVVFLML